MFSLQRFGENDTLTSSATLALGFARADESVQYIRLQNYSSGVTESSAKTVMQYLVDNQILLDSKAESILPTDSVFTAYTERKQVRSLDLS